MILSLFSQPPGIQGQRYPSKFHRAPWRVQLQHFHQMTDIGYGVFSYASVRQIQTFINTVNSAVMASNIHKSCRRTRWFSTKVADNSDSFHLKPGFWFIGTSGGAAEPVFPCPGVRITHLSLPARKFANAFPNTSTLPSGKNSTTRFPQGSGYSRFLVGEIVLLWHKFRLAHVPDNMAQ